jgi:hypothetical protein
VNSETAYLSNLNSSKTSEKEMNFCDNVFYLNPRAMTSIGAESVIFNT